MLTILSINDHFSFELFRDGLTMEYDYYGEVDSCEITKEKAKEIIDFLTKFVEGE